MSTTPYRDDNADEEYDDLVSGAPINSVRSQRHTAVATGCDRDPGRPRKGRWSGRLFSEVTNVANYIVTLRDRRRFDVKNSDDPVVEGTFLTFRAAATPGTPVLARFPADFVISAIIDNKDLVQEVGGDRPMVA